VIVLDASAAVEVLLGLPAAEALMQRIFAPGESIHAPHLVDVEVASVIRRYARSGQITASRGAEAIRDLADFPLTRHGHDVLLDRIWQLRNNVTAHDAAYLACAEALDAVLVTRDAALTKVPGVAARVEVFG